MQNDDTAAISDMTKAMPGPLELSRMHEAELKRCYKQYGLLGALISQIMVGRVIKAADPMKSMVGANAADNYSVTDIKLKDGRVLVYGLPHGRPHNRKRGTLLCEGLGNVEIMP